ncbi:hypothetical protein K3495_g10001 [Podosphaera aphanis]|nr:hypothetical protein K3495_g10001 [Podosphaera aphanis]
MSSLPKNLLDGIDANNIIPRSSRKYKVGKTSAKPLSFATPAHRPLKQHVPTCVSPPPASPITPIGTTTPTMPPPQALAPTQNTGLSSTEIAQMIENSINAAFQKFSLQQAAKPEPSNAPPSPRNNYFVPHPPIFSAQPPCAYSVAPPQTFPAPPPHNFSPHTQVAPQYNHLPPATSIAKFSGKTNVLHFLQDLEARFLMQPQFYVTDRQKIIVAVDHLEGAMDDKTSDAPKEWARLELQMYPELRDDWESFVQRLTSRYQNSALRQRKIFERQTLKQNNKSVQQYKQRFELLCYETNYPRQVWGSQFYQGLTAPLKDKLASVAFIDYDNYGMVSQLAVQFDENYQMRQLQRMVDNDSLGLSQKQPFFGTKPPNSASNPSHPPPPSQQPTTDSRGKISHEVREYRKANNLCMFDGGSHPTHLCPKLIDKCVKEGKALPVDPATLPSKVVHPHLIPSSSCNSLTIASLNTAKVVEVMGEVAGFQTNILVDGAAEVNACVPKIMESCPNRIKTPLNKHISSFNGGIVVPADESYESTLLVSLPGLYQGNVKFVEAPIKSHQVILGLPWLESVNPDIDWISKTIRHRPYGYASPTNNQNITTNAAMSSDLINNKDHITESTISSLARNDAQEEDVNTTIPENLKFLKAAFSKESAAKLPPLREGIDMSIEIPDGKLPRVIPMSRMSEKEKIEAKEQINDLLMKGWIRRCKAQAPANVLFVKKPHSQDLRMCMDYRSLNAITKKDKYPVPNINDLLDKLRGARYFTRLDIISAYNMIHIKPGHEWKTAFRTPDGCFEWLVMPFGLANSPPTWQAFIDRVFRDLNDDIVAYVDDFLIFAQTKELYRKTVNVLRRLIENKLYCKLSKRAFELEEVDFLGFVIGEGGLKISPKRVDTVID